MLSTREARDRRYAVEAIVRHALRTDENTMIDALLADPDNAEQTRILLDSLG